MDAPRQPSTLPSDSSDRRGLVPTDNVTEEVGERDRRVVFVDRTNDLCADGEAAGRSTDRGGHRGQAGQ